MIALVESPLGALAVTEIALATSTIGVRSARSSYTTVRAALPDPFRVTQDRCIHHLSLEHEDPALSATAVRTRVAQSTSSSDGAYASRLTAT